MEIGTIEAAAKGYTEARAKLEKTVTALREALDVVRSCYLPMIREDLAKAQTRRSDLVMQIEAGKDLFVKPRTRVLAGIKVGFQKQRGKVVIADEAKTIQRIRKLIPADQAELLIRVSESVHKPAVYDLTADDLKRLGIAIGDDSDIVVVKPADDGLDKLLAELLPDTETTEE